MIKLDVCFGDFIFAVTIDWHVAWILEEICKLILLKTKCPIQSLLQILCILTKACTLINFISSNSNPTSQREAKASSHFYFTRGHSIFYLPLAPLERWLGSKSSPIKKIVWRVQILLASLRKISENSLKDREGGREGGGGELQIKKWNIPKAVYQTTLILIRIKSSFYSPIHNMLWFNFSWIQILFSLVCTYANVW